MEVTPGDIITLHKYTKNHYHMLYCSWDRACDGLFFILGYFLPFYPPNSPKIKIYEKMKKKKKIGDIIILHICTKNYDHMIYCSWDMACDKCNYFSFWDMFCPFTPLTAQKIKSKKYEKNTWRYHHFSVYQKILSDDVQFLRYGVQEKDK